ncbi:MAG: outer membrane beta-barrel protein [Devosiaceae bacterium]|nr:outer membrane beta-barrel protein [Devosiaceae bacterium MH13]
MLLRCARHGPLLALAMVLAAAPDVAVRDAHAQALAVLEEAEDGEANNGQPDDGEEVGRFEFPQPLPLRPGEEITDPNDPRLAGDEEAQARAAQAGQARRAPTGGLRTFAEDDPEQDGGAGERFRTTGQIRADELERFAIPEGELITGAIGEDGEVPEAEDGFEEDPFAPLGIRQGPLTWFPALDLAVGYDSNVDGTVDAVEVTTLRLSPEVRVVSDWRRHAFEAEVRGSLTAFDDGRDPSLTLETNAELRLDLGLETAVTLRGGYLLEGEAESDPNAAAGASGLTDTQEIRGALGVARRVGPVEVSGEVEASRFLFADTSLGGGGTQANDDRDRTDFEATLRLERAEGPLIRPFAEGSVTVRRFDQSVDRNGFRRDSLGYALRGGLIVADDAPLRGSVSLGVAGETFDDDALDDAVALTAQAGLTWDVTALTSATLDIETTLDPTTRAGSGVGVTRSVVLGLSHRLRRNVELRASAGVEDTDFSGTDDETRTYSGSAGVTWQMSRVVGFRIDGTYSHEPDNAGDVDAFTLEAGVTLRR